MDLYLESRRIVRGALATVSAGVLLAAVTAAAADVPIPVRVYINKSDSKTKFVAQGTSTLPDAAASDPTVEGGAITFSSGAASETLALPAMNWSALGNPPGATGFKYADASGATCKKILVKRTSIKGLCKGTGPAAPPFDAGADPPLSIVLAIGTPAQRYCAECPNGGDQKGNPERITKLTDCPAPASCPSLGPVCGDNVAEGTEECDGSDAVACPGMCTAGCTCAVCGNNVVEGTEACDGIEAPACPGTCLADCTCPTCGNGIAEGPEECDGSDAPLCPGFCTGSCTCSTDPECCTVPAMPMDMCVSTAPASCVSGGGTPMASGVCNLLTGSCHHTSTCGGSGPACDGPCPAGGSCIASLFGCVCSAGPCGTFPMCEGGSCPGSYLCGELPGSGACACLGF